MPKSMIPANSNVIRGGSIYRDGLRPQHTGGFAPSPAELHIPTKDDLREYGAAESFAAFCQEFEALHARHEQYRGWTDGAFLAVVRRQIRSQWSVLAEPGDLVLAKQSTYGAGEVSAYAPRTGHNLGLNRRDVHTVYAVATI